VESSFEYVFLFLIFFIAHLVSALYSPIQDCDEVFNYWEPTHYLNHGYGMQTWEYSPVYAIRSWLYIGLHAIIIAVGRLLPFISKTAEFYFLRVTLACVCAICETTFFNIIAKTLNRRIAYFFTIIVIFSPGTFHAVTAYLPSTFAMYCNMLGVAAFMNWRGGLRTAQGIFWFAIGGIWGWPFASVLALPFFIEELCLAFANGALIGLLLRCSDGVMKSAIALVISTF
jgi:alpha-1,2-mannosyltransferase